MLKRALISVYDKTNLLTLVQFLQSRAVEILSTGGTFRFLKENGIAVTEVSDVTGFEEILDGRVKTLHPIIHSGILAVRDNKEHMKTLRRKEIKPIDMVVVNLYPFFEKVEEELSFEEKIEFIDIGGPTMLRAAAKNFKDVIVLTDTADYERVTSQLENSGKVDFQTRKQLAGKVFNLMSAYDAAISNYLLEDDSYPEYLTLSYRKRQDLRYGENPHQGAAYYTATTGRGAMKSFSQLHGKELSYNNIKDMDMAWKVVCEFENTVCCAVKHNTPCGAALGTSVKEAYIKTYECDPLSIFGGIVAFNREVDRETAEELVKIFLEIVIAPGFSEEALEVLKEKKNLRVVKAVSVPNDRIEFTAVDGGVLVQETDRKLIDNINYVTENKPDKEQMTDLMFGMKIVKFVKSNAIVVVKDSRAVGIGGGQTNRIWAAAQALDRGKDGVVLASDAFFPFEDVVEEAARHNIKAIIQPGGSVRDKDSIEACNRQGIAMVFTGMRHFKH